MNQVARQASDQSLTARVEELFAPWDHGDTPGAALVVVKEGEVICQQGYGCANLEYDVPITPATIFGIASVSKQFTAFAIALLAHQDQLALDDDIRRYVPEVPDLGKRITVRHLVHHTGGLRCIYELMTLAGWRRDDVYTREQIMKIIRHMKALDCDPGAEHRYSNIGYFLLAEIVERVTGQTLRQFCAAEIFGPLGMSRTHFHDDHEMVVKNMAYSYAPDATGGYRKSISSVAYAGSTNLYTNVEDLARWLLNFQDLRLGGPAVMKQMLEQGILDSGERISYAFGLYSREHRGHRMIYHSGGHAGYRSYLVHFPEQRVGVALLSNLSTFEGQAERLALQVAGMAMGADLVPAEPPMVQVDLSLYADYSGHYLMPDGSVTIIRQEGNRLVSQMIKYPRLELLPLSETVFCPQGIWGVTGTFHRDSKGRVRRMVIRIEDQVVPAEKFEPIVLTPDQLVEYTGDYCSDEVGTTYTLVVENGLLVAQHRRHSDTPLIPTLVDQFAGFERGFACVRFTRDGEGKVNGFSVTEERVRNLPFYKVDLDNIASVRKARQ